MPTRRRKFKKGFGESAQMRRFNPLTVNMEVARALTDDEDPGRKRTLRRPAAEGHGWRTVLRPGLLDQPEGPRRVH